MEWWSEIARYWSATGSTRRVVLLGCTLLGISSGVLGTFALLRRQSLLGDALSHAALPGICLAFLLTQVKHPLYFLLGATASGLLGAWVITTITRKSRIKNDAALGLVLSVFFGVGIMLLTVIQQSGSGNQAGLNTFLFGQAAFLLYNDVLLLALMGSLLILLVFFFFKEFKLLSFDAGFAAGLGLPVRFLDLFLTGLVVLAVMIGLQSVGVILMAALLILPAAAARQWSDRLERMTLLAAAFGGFSGALGAFVSTILPKMPTGPVMVLTASSILLLSLFGAPNRGLLPQWLRRRRSRQRIQEENLLKTCYRLGEDFPEERLLCSLDDLQAHLSLNDRALERLCQRLAAKELLLSQGDSWSLTDKGQKQAQRVLRNHRLWELYLSRKADIAADHVHRDAEEMEHILSPELVRQLEELLEAPGEDPHGRPIPPSPEEVAAEPSTSTTRRTDASSPGAE